ncbi:MAG: C39 family peptidase [Candidatus Xenobia bacterium]
MRRIVVALLLLGASIALAAPDPHAAVLPVPLVRQSTDYSCGCASMESVLMYWGQEFREDELIKGMHATPTDGTDPDQMVAFARHHGLNAEFKQNQTLHDLEQALQRQVPPILDIEAWRDKPNGHWETDWDDGHYVVLVGMDTQNLYLMDPSVLGGHGWMRRDELGPRWHDEDSRHHHLIHGVIYVEGKRPQPPPAWTHTD